MTVPAPAPAGPLVAAVPTAAVPRAGLDPDRDEARRRLAEELAHPDYHRPESLVERAVDWVAELLEGLFGRLDPSGGPDLTAAVVLGVVLLAVAVGGWLAVRGRRRSRVRTGGAGGGVIDEPALSAADYRARAGGAAARGDWDAVLLDSYRALAAGSGERALIPASPGLTAHEVAALLAVPFPDRAAALRRAGDEFDAVRYGGRAATQGRAEQVRELEAEVAQRRPVTTERGPR